MRTLLVVEDSDEQLFLTEALRRVGLHVTIMHQVEHVLERWSDEPAEMLILALPLLDPLATMRALQQITIVPVIVLLSHVTEELHLSLLRAGADLVLVRPYSILLFMEYAHVICRRASSVPRENLPVLRFEHISLDPTTRLVSVRGRTAVPLTPQEFRLLHTLMVHCGDVLSIETLITRVWNRDGRGDPEALRGLIMRLRRKLDPHPIVDQQFITNVPGRGYSFLWEH